MLDGAQLQRYVDLYLELQQKDDDSLIAGPKPLPCPSHHIPQGGVNRRSSSVEAAFGAGKKGCSKDADLSLMQIIGIPTSSPFSPTDE